MPSAFESVSLFVFGEEQANNPVTWYSSRILSGTYYSHFDWNRIIESEYLFSMTIGDHTDSRKKGQERQFKR